MKVCFSCAAAEADGATFPKKERGARRLCDACLDEQRRNAEVGYWAGRTYYTISRASYRAALRQRQKQPQSDWVDAAAKCP